MSDFADWIYRLQGTRKDEGVLREAKQGELAVKQKKKQIPALSARPDWTLVFNDPIESKPEPFEISLLTVNNLPLYGAPDYVFENKATNTLLIVEVKITDGRIWTDGWPNLRAQLWAYAHIDKFVNRGGEILLIGEVWGRRNDRHYLRQTLCWKISDPAFYTQNEQLFAAYKRWVEASQARRGNEL